MYMYFTQIMYNKSERGVFHSLHSHSLFGFVLLFAAVEGPLVSLFVTRL